MTNERLSAPNSTDIDFARFEDRFSPWTCVHSCLTCVRVRKERSVGKTLDTDLGLCYLEVAVVIIKEKGHLDPQHAIGLKVTPCPSTLLHTILQAFEPPRLPSTSTQMLQPKLAQTKKE